MREGAKQAVLYSRVSTDEQARSGYSLAQQIDALRAYAEREGYEVVEEVRDPGESGASLERPGMDRVRDLVEAGSVSVVLAQDADRISREPVHRAILDEEMERHGARLVALDDWGDESHEGQLLRYMKGWVSKGERLKTKERTRRGLRRKMREGKVIRVSRPPYGFRYNEEGDTLLISEPEMAVIRRIFHMIGVEGATMGAVMKVLTRDGVTAPSGPGYNWHRPTIRNFVKNDLYRPHTVEEVREFVAPMVAGALAPDGAYGLWTFDKRHRTQRRERDKNGEYRNRLKFEAAPREEWSVVPVDLSDAGISRRLVDAARERLAGNTRRPPTTRAGRFWQLSGGIARCAVCGCALTPLPMKRKHKVTAYYRCFQRYNDGPRDCTNFRTIRAEELEEAVWWAVYQIIARPDRLLTAYEEHLERQKRQVCGDPDREARDLHERLQELDQERRGYLRQNAREVLSDAELADMLEEVDEQRRGFQKALREAQSRQEALRRPEEQRVQFKELIVQLHEIDLRIATPEDRRRVYEALGLEVRVDEDRTARISGVFDPDIYLPGLLQDVPDLTTPQPEVPDGSKVVVSLDNLREGAS